MVVVVCEAKQTTRTMRCEERYHQIDVITLKIKKEIQNSDMFKQ